MNQDSLCNNEREPSAGWGGRDVTCGKPSPSDQNPALGWYEFTVHRAQFFLQSGCLGIQHKVDGKLHLRLNTCTLTRTVFKKVDKNFEERVQESIQSEDHGDEILSTLV